MGISTTWGVALPISLTGIPIAYFLNQSAAMTQPLSILIAGIVCLVMVFVIPAGMMIIRGEKLHPVFYVLAIFTFSSVMDMVLALELDGIISSFMSFYLLEGEPYLATAHGTMIMYWDGVAHLFMYILMVHAQSKGQKWYREVGLYWVGSIVNSMLVLVPGSIVGKFGIKWSILMNIPYFILPIWLGYRFLISGASYQARNTKSAPTPLWKRPLDVFFFLYLLSAMVFTCFRGLTVLGCNSKLSHRFINEYEPYMRDDSSYPKMQMLVYLYYFVPYYVCALFGLWYGSHQPWMMDWSLLHAGAAAQGQFSYITGAIHHSTDAEYRLPSDPTVRLVFFLVNGVLFVIPQLMAIRHFYGSVSKPELHPLERSSIKEKKTYKQK